jgi:hypothetical protein
MHYQHSTKIMQDLATAIQQTGLKDGDTLIVLVGGGTKRGQQRDIDQAKALHTEYKARKKTAQSGKQGQTKGN